MSNIKIIRGVFDTKLELRPANPDYPVFKIEAGDDFQVWGVVIHLIRTFESI